MKFIFHAGCPRCGERTRAIHVAARKWACHECGFQIPRAAVTDGMKEHEKEVARRLGVARQIEGDE